LPGNVVAHEPGSTCDENGHKMRKTSFSCPRAGGTCGAPFPLPLE
jgi:hypothetical protein